MTDSKHEELYIYVYMCGYICVPVHIHTLNSNQLVLIICFLLNF